MTKLTVLTLVTKSYIKMLDDYFLPTLPKDIDRMKILYLNDMDSVYGNASKITTFEIKKLEMILEEIRANMGNNIFFIDGDVVFSGRTFKDEVNKILEEHDLLFQFNDAWYNFGVFAVNCNERTEEFFCHFLEIEMPKAYNLSGLHDQHIVNGLLNIYHPNAGFTFETEKVFDNLKHTSLPIKYFANHLVAHRYPQDTPDDVILIHATNTYSMEEKKALMSDFKDRCYDSRQKES